MSIDERVARTEQSIVDMKEDVSDIKYVVTNLRDNHLEHLKGQITALDTKITYYIGGGTAIITVLELITKFLK